MTGDTDFEMQQNRGDDYPARRPRRVPSDYYGPRPQPGQTVMICPTERKHTLFKFTDNDTLLCLSCTYEIPREDAI